MDNINESYPKSLTAKRFKQAIIKRKEVKIKELAANLKIDSETIRRWIQKHRGVPKEKLEDVATYFKVPSRFFLVKPYLAEKYVLEIIDNPELMDTYMPETDNIVSSNDAISSLPVVNSLSPQLLNDSKYILDELKQLEDEENKLVRHFFISCRGKGDLLYQKEILENMEKTLEPQLYKGDNIETKYKHTKAALRAIDYMIYLYSDPFFCKERVRLSLQDLMDLIFDIKDEKSMTAPKFERLKWLLDTIFIECNEISFWYDDNYEGLNYPGQIYAILLVIEFGYNLYGKETLNEFFGDYKYEYYSNLLEKVNSLLAEYKQERFQKYRDGYFKYFEGLIKLFNKGLSSKKAYFNASYATPFRMQSVLYKVRKEKVQSK